MTYIAIQNRVKTRVIDLPPSVSADIPYLINEAIRSAQRQYNWRAMEQSATMITTPGSNVPTPNTLALFKEYRDKGPYLSKYLVRARRFIATSGPDAALATLNDPNNLVEPRYLINTVDQTTGTVSFTIAGLPDNISDWPDGNYRIIVPYYAYSATLVNDSDENWFTLNLDDYIYREATAQAFGLNWDYNSQAVWQAQAKIKLDEAKKADKMQRLGAVDAFVPHWQGANEPQVRR